VRRVVRLCYFLLGRKISPEKVRARGTSPGRREKIERGDRSGREGGREGIDGGARTGEREREREVGGGGARAGVGFRVASRPQVSRIAPASTSVYRSMRAVHFRGWYA
jgi:hypothetical protein